VSWLEWKSAAAIVSSEFVEHEFFSYLTGAAKGNVILKSGGADMYTPLERNLQ